MNDAPTPGGLYAIEAADGRCLAFDPPAGFRLAPAHERTWFEVRATDDGRIFVLATHGRYLCATPDGELVASPIASGWESFRVEWSNDGGAVLRSLHGTWLCACTASGRAGLMPAPPDPSRRLRCVRANPDAINALRSCQADETTPTRQVVWTFWDRGEAAMPPIYRLNVRGWRHLLGPSWQVVVMNTVDGDVEHVLRRLSPRVLPATFAQLSPVVQSDAVRLAILASEGGVWMDPSIILIRHLDDIGWRALCETGGAMMMAGFYNATWGSACQAGRDAFESWFIASRKGNPLMARWCDVFARYWRDRVTSTDIWRHPLFAQLDLTTFHRHGLDYRNYLVPHVAFRRVIEHDPVARLVWSKHLLLADANTLAFDLTRVTGWRPQDIHDRLVGDCDELLVARLLKGHLMKFTSAMIGDLARLDEPRLRAPHTLGRIYASIFHGDPGGLGVPKKGNSQAVRATGNGSSSAE